jgi:hypothetical protein
MAGMAITNTDSSSRYMTFSMTRFTTKDKIKNIRNICPRMYITTVLISVLLNDVRGYKIRM